MPLMVISARIIDLLDEKAGKKLDQYNFWGDVLEAALDAFDPYNFAEGKGGFFSEWKADTGRYLTRCSDHVKDWLRRLRQQGKPLFLMTSSHADYAIASMTFILGKEWQTYFDLTLTNARKPGFFKHKRQFIKIEGTSETSPTDELCTGGVYAQGNAKTLMKFFTKITGKAKPKVLYFGDSLRADISPSKIYARWDTALVLEEIESEQAGYEAEEQSADEPEAKRQRMMAPSKKERDYLTSTQWGSFFTDIHPFEPQGACGPRRMNTLWGYMVRKYADVAIPQFDYITDLPLDHKLATFNHEKTLTWGFCPTIPEALRPTAALNSASTDR